MNGIEHQRAFAARIRRPAQEALLPGVGGMRMAVYEALFFNTLESLLSGTFPLLRSLLAPARWHALVRAFMVGHRASTPYFLEVSQEFLAWLQQGYRPAAGDPSFMLELAHYEWVELALDVSDAELPVRGWSPLAWPLAYVWPVQRIGRDCQPRRPPAKPSCLLAWRDARDKVRFMQLSPFAYRLALRLQAGERPFEALMALANEHGLPAGSGYFDNARALLDDWRRQDIWFPSGEGNVLC